MSPEGGDMPQSSSPPPSTTSAEPAKPRKDVIVEVATRLFAERGYEGTSMGDVAESVGLRKASLFHHFESKEVLYETTIARVIDEVRAAIFVAIESRTSFVERLDAWSDAMVAVLGARPYAARLLAREMMDADALAQAPLAPLVTTLLGDAVAFAKAAQREGVFRTDVDPEHLVLSLIGVYFMPFLVERIVDRTTGMSPFDPRFVAERRRIVCLQVRALALAASET